MRRGMPSPCWALMPLHRPTRLPTLPGLSMFNMSASRECSPVDGCGCTAVAPDDALACPLSGKPVLDMVRSVTSTCVAWIPLPQDIPVPGGLAGRLGFLEFKPCASTAALVTAGGCVKRRLPNNADSDRDTTQTSQEHQQRSDSYTADMMFH